MNSYNYYFEWDRLSEIFQEPYASDLPGYFDGGQFMNAINENLPQSIDELLTATFIESYRGDGELEFKTALQNNSLLSYSPAAPVLLIHGKADMTVPLQNTITAWDYYVSRGKNNVDTLLIEGDHEGAAPAAIVAAMSWFESLENK
jgi:fermentation-respiration switch protein FrsA (DUF1100 family)